MPTTLSIEASRTGSPLLPSILSQAFARMAQGRERVPRGLIRGQTLRLVLSLAPEDDAAAAFDLEFVRQGAIVRGSAHGPSAALFAWAMHAVAKALAGSLEADGRAVTPDPTSYLPEALAYLEGYENDVGTRRRSGRGREESGRAFLEWLEREEHVALAGDAADLGAKLSMTDAPSLYEQLLESDAVEDVFVGERELGGLLARFFAERPPS